MIILALKRVETYLDPDTWEEVEENNVIPIEYVVREELHGEDMTICESLEEAEKFIREYSNRIICDECGEDWSDKELDSYAWHCLKCGHKIGD